jgi:hypothetical protein
VGLTPKVPIQHGRANVFVDGTVYLKIRMRLGRNPALPRQLRMTTLNTKLQDAQEEKGALEMATPFIGRLLPDWLSSALDASHCWYIAQTGFWVSVDPGAVCSYPPSSSDTTQTLARQK